jgi:hypothetical protein
VSTGDQLFKVLVEGRGTYSHARWPLPGDDAPGEWLKVGGPLVMCENGLHLTDWQGVWEHWMRWSATVYRAEVDGETLGAITDTHGDRKLAARRARLLSVVPDAELPPWWLIARQQVRELPSIAWLKTDGNPDPTWRTFETHAAAESAARSAAVSAARSAAVSAARSAAVSAAGSAARVSGVVSGGVGGGVGGEVGGCVSGGVSGVSQRRGRRRCWRA